MIYLVDFDITVTKKDTLETLMRKYNPEAISIIKQKYKNKEISMYDYVEQALLSLNITKEEYFNYLAQNVEIDESFITFFKRNKVKIVSFGTNLNVISVLSKYDINLKEDDVIAHNIEINNKKIQIISDIVNKKAIVEKLKENEKVIFVGDGPADYEAMRVADYVYARSGTRAVKYLSENNINFSSFNDFYEIEEFEKKRKE